MNGVVSGSDVIGCFLKRRTDVNAEQRNANLNYYLEVLVD
jgi:hypothetical protein